MWGIRLLPMGTMIMMHSCAEVYEPIELSFGVVSGVGLDRVHVAQKKGRFGGGWVRSHSMNGVFLNINVFDSCVLS